MSQGTGVAYRRVILELAHGASDPVTLDAAARFAHLLDLELHGFFVEDEALLALADLPFAREIRMPAYRWNPIDPGRLADELRQEAQLVRRRLDAVVQALGVPNAFEVVRGDPASWLAEQSGETDIVVIAAPATTGADLSYTIARVHAAAHRAEAAVLLLPPRSQQQSGIVVAVLAEASDPSLAIAARIAEAAGERLLVLVPASTEAEQSVAEWAANRGIGARMLTVRALPGLQPDNIIAALSRQRVRLIVMTRAAGPANGLEAASRIGMACNAAVLLAAPGAGQTSKP
jgi:hypothetical protein